MRRPAPWPRPVRVLCVLFAVLAVCALGSLALGRHVSGTDQAGGREDTVQKTDAGQDGSDASDEWNGLKAAGVPVPGDWSRETAYRLVVEDGQARYPVDDSESSVDPIDGMVGPVDAALATLNALLDPDTDDETWAARTLELIEPDAAGGEHPLSDAPRWWWAERRFAPATLCSAPADPYVQGQYRGGCTSSGTWDAADQEAVGTASMFASGSTDFPLPDGIQVDSLTNPQDVASRAYGVVSIPMDDGIWHITTYCPASLDGVAVDSQGNELTDLDGVDEAWTTAGLTGFGTRQRPCVTVEVAVGGQKPFWWFGE